MGLNLYDVMAVERLRGGRARRRTRGEVADVDGDGLADWSPDRHRIITGDEVSELLPALAHREPTAGYLFYDCQTDDVRLVLTVLRRGRALRRGLRQRPGGHRARRGGRPHRAACCVRDAETGEEFACRADNVVNATGVWADRLRPEELHDEAEVPRIRPSRGTHITLAHDTLPLVAGAIVPAGGGRSIFALPWLGGTLIGTTDNDYDTTELDHIRPAAEDVEYLLDATNAFFGTRADAGDITGAYAGVRPLISTGDPKKSVDISRKAELYETSSGMITITGGKLTTWRRMAKMAVDRIVEREARDAPVPHARDPARPGGRRRTSCRASRACPRRAYAQLAGRYGHAARDVLAIAAERGELAQPIADGPATCSPRSSTPPAASRPAASATSCCAARASACWRRARSPSRPGTAAERVARAMAPELGWDDAPRRGRGRRRSWPRPPPKASSSPAS